MCTICLFGLQWLFVVCCPPLPGVLNGTRARVVPWHCFFGMVIFLIAIRELRWGWWRNSAFCAFWTHCGDRKILLLHDCSYCYLQSWLASVLSFQRSTNTYVGELGCNFEVYQNDAVEELARRKSSAILISPGPGSPKDSGISLETVLKLGPAVPVYNALVRHLEGRLFDLLLVLRLEKDKNFPC